ncbi:Hypothetical protein HDN1F_26560 [gamma proteobacterium HdN1]|nr:Hypothetical protein HDN1F_26560 [gamma proteobacterium HdN1]
MNYSTPIITDLNTFPALPDSAQLAILLPTGRWNAMARSIIGAFLGVANEEVIVLIGDNSESKEKRDFLKGIRKVNPYIISVSHKKNVGARNNFFYLLDWCKDIEYTAQSADDDWVSPSYHTDAYETLKTTPSASCAETGSAWVDIGDRKLVNISQPSMCGDTPLQRISGWNATTARITCYNTSRRAALQAGMDFLRASPLLGLTMHENLWELSRLSEGDFISTAGNGVFVHYPEYGSKSGDPTQRFYNLLCKDAGLAFPAIYFMGLNTAIQCAVFIGGKYSPIRDKNERNACAAHVFQHIYQNAFISRFSSDESRSATFELFKARPDIIDSFVRYTHPEFCERPVLSNELIEWFIQIIAFFESEASGHNTSQALTRFLKL